MVNTTPSGRTFGGYQRLWLFKQQERFQDLETRIERLEDALKRRDLDWEDLADRCKRMMGRVVKERARIDAATQAQEANGDVGENGEPPSPHQNTTLSAHHKQIQQQILRRRMGAL